MRALRAVVDIVAWAALSWVVVWSALSFLVMLVDKRRAHRRGRRVPERRLLALALLGGAIGSWLAMSTLRHKTRHARFRFGLPLLALAWLGALVWLWFDG